MTRPRVPKPAKVLRGLFWTLLFRGRGVPQGQTQTKRRQFGLAGTLVAYAAVGYILTLTNSKADSFVFASLLHAATFMFASLTLAANAGTMLFVKEEAEILLHRPVTPQEMLRAKCSVLVGFALLLALALNSTGLFVGVSQPGATWRFIPAHLLSTGMLMLFSTSSIILVYNLCLRWFGRERLDNLLATVQSVLTVGMVVGGQMLPRMLTPELVQSLNKGMQGWVLALPPAWFGALDALLGGTTLDHSVFWLPAAGAVVATALTTWLALEKLGDAYGKGLMGLNESSADSKNPQKSRGRWLAAMVKLPPLAWWLKDPVERQAFTLTAAYLLRDREIKLRLYPGVAPMIIMPVMVLLTGSGRNGGSNVVEMMQGFATCFLGMVPLQAMLFLNCSEHWRASACFYSAPLPHWSPLFLGARKAVLVCLTFPILAFVTAVMCGLKQSFVPLALSLPALFFLPTFSLIPAVMAPWLPLSKPAEDVKNSLNGCLLMTGTMVAAGVVGGLASYSWRMNWFWPYLVILALAMIGIGWLLRHLIRERSWPVMGE